MDWIFDKTLWDIRNGCNRQITFSVKLKCDKIRLAPLLMIMTQRSFTSFALLLQWNFACWIFYSCNLKKCCFEVGTYIKVNAQLQGECDNKNNSKAKKELLTAQFLPRSVWPKYNLIFYIIGHSQ